MILPQFILELIFSGVPHVVLTIYEDDSKACSKGNMEPRNLGPGPWLWWDGDDDDDNDENK